MTIKYYWSIKKKLQKYEVSFNPKSVYSYFYFLITARYTIQDHTTRPGYRSSHSIRHTWVEYLLIFSEPSSSVPIMKINTMPYIRGIKLYFDYFLLKEVCTSSNLHSQEWEIISQFCSCDFQIIFRSNCIVYCTRKERKLCNNTVGKKLQQFRR